MRRVIRDADASGTDVHVTTRIVGANAVRLSRYRDFGSATWLSCGRVGLRRADAFWRVAWLPGLPN